MEILFAVLHFIGILLMVLMVFNLMIVVHEWGHFLAGRWRGLKIEAFQIWFGKPIWKKTINGVQYGLGTIPFGGFVKLPQMAPMDAIEGKGDEPMEKLPPITPLDKIIVAVAGPLFSFLLAVTFAFLVYWQGKPVYEADATTQIGYVKKDSPADRGGLKPGDTVLNIDGKHVRSFGGIVDSIRWMIVASEGSKINFEVNRPGEGIKHFEVEAEKPKVDPNLSFWRKLVTRPPFRSVGIGAGFPVVVADFLDDKPNTPAEQAGVKKGDRILSINGTPMYSAGQLSEYFENAPGTLGKPQDLEIQRQVGKELKTLHVSLTPRLPDQRPANWKVEEAPLATTGMVFKNGGERKDTYPTVAEQINDAARTISQTLRAISPASKSDVSAQHLSSVVGIVHSYFILFDDPKGFQLVLWFSVVLNVNLAILNMLPFPVLDGGHIVMAIMEGIRRRPLNIRVLEVVQGTFVILLLGFMLLLTMKDTGDLFGMSQKPKDGKQQTPDPRNEEPIKFTAPDAK